MVCFRCVMMFSCWCVACAKYGYNTVLSGSAMRIGMAKKMVVVYDNIAIAPSPILLAR